MAEDIESQNGNLVDQLTLLNENLKEDLDKKRKDKRDRSGLTSALNKLTPAVTSLGAIWGWYFSSRRGYCEVRS